MKNKLLAWLLLWAAILGTAVIELFGGADERDP